MVWGSPGGAWGPWRVLESSSGGPGKDLGEIRGPGGSWGVPGGFGGPRVGLGLLEVFCGFPVEFWGVLGGVWEFHPLEWVGPYCQVEAEQGQATPTWRGRVPCAGGRGLVGRGAGPGWEEFHLQQQLPWARQGARELQQRAVIGQRPQAKGARGASPQPQPLGVPRGVLELENPSGNIGNLGNGQETMEEPTGAGGAAGDTLGAHAGPVAAGVRCVGSPAELAGDTEVPPKSVEAALGPPAVVGALSALIPVPAQPPLLSVARGAEAAKAPWEILAAVLARDPRLALVHIVALVPVSAQCKAGAAAAAEGAEGVEAVLGAAGAHGALVHVKAGAAVRAEAEPGVAATGEGSRGVGAAVLAPAELALVLIHALGAPVSVARGAAALKAPREVDAVLAGPARGGPCALVHICAGAVGGGAESGGAAAVGGRGRARRGRGRDRGRGRAGAGAGVGAEQRGRARQAQVPPEMVQALHGSPARRRPRPRALVHVWRGPGGPPQTSSVTH